MADVFKGLTIRLGADTTGLSKGIRDAKREMSGVPAELRKIERALKLDPGNTRLLSQQQAEYRKAISSTERQLEALRAAESQIGSEGMSSEQWVRLQSDIAACEQRLKGYRSVLADSIVQQTAAESAMGRAGARLKAWGDSLQPVGQRAERIGGTLSRAVTPAVLAMGAAGVAAAVEMDDALTGVRKTVDGTEQQYQALKSAAVEFSTTNAVSASQILDIQALGAQLGYSIDELQEFGEVVSGLDIATNMSAEDAATELAQFANIMGMAHDETRNYGSTIVDLGNSFATTEADISHMAMRIAGAGKSIGLTEADVLGLATALASMGIEAEAGGTAISTIMATIDKDVALNSDSIATWAATANMGVEQFKQAWGTDAVGALSSVLVGMDAAVQEGGNMTAMLSDLGVTSIRQTDTMKRLANNSEFLGRAVSTANTAWRENSALDAEVENRNKSLSAQFEMLKNRVVAIADSYGGPLCSSMLDIVDAAEPLIEAISEGARTFSEMGEREQQAIIQAVALSAAVGPMLSVFGRGLQGVTRLGEGIVGVSRTLAAAKIAYRESAAGATAAGGAHAAGSAGVRAFGAALKANPVGLAITALAALIPVLTAVGAAFLTDSSAANSLTVASREQSDRVDALRERYESLCASQGSGSDAALRAKAAYEEEAAALEQQRQTVAQLTDQCNDAVGAHNSMIESIDAEASAADSSAGSILSLADDVAALSSAEGASAEQKAELQAKVDALNSALGREAVSYDEVSGAISMTADEVRDLARAEADRIRTEAAVKRYNQLLEDSVSIDADLAEAQENLEAASKGFGIWIGDFPVIADDANLAYRDLEAAARDLEAAQAENADRTDEALAVVEESARRNQALAQAVGEVKAGNMSAAEAAEAYGAALEGGIDETQVAVEAQAQLAAESEELGKELAKVVEELDGYAARQPGFARAMEESGWSAQDLAQHLMDTGNEAGELTKLYDELREGATGAFEEINTSQEVSLDKMLETLEHNRQAVADWGRNLEELYEKCGSDQERAYVEQLAAMGTDSAAILQALNDDTTGKLSELAAATDAGGQAASDAMATRFRIMRDRAATEAEDMAAAVGLAVEAMAEATGESADAIMAKLAEAGASEQQLAALTDEQLAALVASYDGNVASVLAMLDEFEAENRDAGASAARGLAENYGAGRTAVAGSGRSLYDAGAAEIDRLPGRASEDGAAASRNFAASLPLYRDAARSNAGQMADAARNMNRDSGKFWGWGNESGNNFADGIGAAYERAKTAAETVANIVRNIFGHSVPKEGPLRNNGKGEIEWGMHSVQNYAAGMLSALPDIRRASAAVAEAQRSGMTASAARATSEARAAARDALAQRERIVAVSSDGGARAEVQRLRRDFEGFRRELGAVIRENTPDRLRVNGREWARLDMESRGRI